MDDGSWGLEVLWGCLFQLAKMIVRVVSEVDSSAETEPLSDGKQLPRICDYSHAQVLIASSFQAIPSLSRRIEKRNYVTSTSGFHSPAA
jgi:hypothetical protein